MCIRVLIADDESGMRLVLRKVIERIEGFQVVGEAEDGSSALSLVEELNPEVVFLDIEMPNLDGIECAKLISDIDPKKMIVFATAHPSYMPDAFEVYAFDYITKPFKVDRIIKTLNRIKEISSEENNKGQEDIVYQQSVAEKLIIKNKDGINFIDIDSIILIQREGKSTVIYTSDNKYTTSDGLNDIEGRLGKINFFRCHKSYLINISKIVKISPYGRWTYVVHFKDIKNDALITHKKYEELKILFNLS
ncbi:LytTR family DNA-binding domain-containing protein [Proteiniborus sp. MB09-C3]|uniref:LytR/AlgR family response regulator transcription factor n=1 Tax=Proteiniborus sp. MB09-C3 TaxID=3050072 RepID=UPI0025522869|nr:LytTR family DNA-binding domain-containing protein [Proteiniborus sp. MB09-C3]WIV10673.1 LytTR family DNA-binding domain-containing protein [Proteiniborus sp. MB09-C3]